jgi:DHA1 family multidrug resistance protein-like MFS transporter
MTVVAVVSDSLLHPFFPQYFSVVFGVHDPAHVGLYIAACAFTVLVCFPAWALVARRVPVMRILVATQVVTSALNLACWTISSLPAFWFVSLTAMAFKASYLLIYPYVMSLEDKDQHIGTIGLLAFVVHFGDIIAGIISGTVLQLAEPRLLFLIMAFADALQIVLCVALARAHRVSAPSAPEAAAIASPEVAPPKGFVIRLGVVMMVLYFSAYLTEPFFSVHWEHLAAMNNRIVSGLVYAIPGITALVAIIVNARRAPVGSAHAGIAPAITMGLCGLWLQVSGYPAVVVIGRILYGWALFQSFVRLDLLLFHGSERADYAVDFSKANLFQGMGTLFASLVASGLVRTIGSRAPFWVAGGGFLLGVLLYLALFRRTTGREHSRARGLADVGALDDGRAAT